MELGLNGRSVIVTGGSGGIGRGLVLAFAAEGANVAIASRDAAQSEKVAEAAKGLVGTVAVIPTDVTDPTAVAALVARAEARFGPIDLRVGAAGRAHQLRLAGLDRAVADRSRLRRIGRPEDVATLTLFLASERAAHITGQLVSVSGGAWMP